MGQRGNILQNVDWVIIGLYFALCLLGLLNIYAADFNAEDPDFLDLGHRSGKQLLWIVCSAFIALSVMSLDGKFYHSLAFPIFLIILALQVIVIFKARDVNGARAWLDVGPFKLQPAEFSKFATSLFLSVYMGRQTLVKDNSSNTTMEDVGKKFWRFISGKKVFSIQDISIQNQVIPLVIIFSPVVMILGQDDTGTALVFLSFFFVLYREGVIGWLFWLGLSIITITILTLMFDQHTMYVLLGVIAIVGYGIFIKNPKVALASLGVVILYFITKSFVGWNDALDTFVLWGWICINLMSNFLIPEFWKRVEKLMVLFVLVLSIGYVNSVSWLYQGLKSYQRARIDSVLGKLEDPNLNFQTDQSLNAIGSGGLIGKGFLEGTHTKGKWVPEQSTDYIFCTVGEEWGFLGTAVVIILFMSLIMRVIYKAEMQRYNASRIYGYCVASILFFHLLVNIGMTIQIMPVIGIPLPFFSYGGSSLFGFTILVFLFVKFDSQRLDVL